MPGWAIVGVLIALSVWTVGLAALTHRTVLAGWVALTGDSPARAAGVSFVLPVGLTLWCILTVCASLLWRELFGVGTWASGLLAFGMVAAGAPIVAHVIPSQAGLSPTRESLLAAGASPSTARAIRWVSAPFGLVEMMCLIVAPIAALAP